jgi:hypothetical protein
VSSCNKRSPAICRYHFCLAGASIGCWPYTIVVTLHSARTANAGILAVIAFLDFRIKQVEPVLEEMPPHHAPWQIGRAAAASLR